MSPLFAIFFAFLISATISWVMVRGHLKLRLPVDMPNPRSLHSDPVPRSGGIAVMVAVAFTAWPLQPKLFWLVAIAMVLSLVSFMDDLRGLSVKLRLATHFIGAAIVLSQLSLPIPILFMLVIAVSASTNIFNFMDGANGLAAGVGLIGFSLFAIAALSAGDTQLSLMSAGIAAASAGFLIFNFGRARLFLGDVGSIPLGFLAGIIGAIGWARNAWPLIFPVLVFFPFIADATVTLTRRAILGQTVWQSHREHYYQRLILMGWKHWRVALTYYGLALASGCLGLVFFAAPGVLQWTGAISIIAITFVLMRKVDQHWRRRRLVVRVDF